MKRCIFSLMIPALLVADIASSAEIYNKNGNTLDLYGKVNGTHFIAHKGIEKGDLSSVNFGMKGNTKITDYITGYGQWEYKAAFNLSENESSKNNYMRLAFVGLKLGDAGSFDYGRNYGIMYDISAWTDIIPMFGGNAYSSMDNFFFNRANSLATYRNHNFFGLVDGLNLAVQYQHQNKNNSLATKDFGRSILNENGSGWGFSTSYDIGNGVEIGAAFFQSARTQDQNGGKDHEDPILGRGGKARAYIGGIKYDMNNIYLAAIYGRSYKATPFGSPSESTFGYANVADNLEMVAQYQFDFGLRPSVGYSTSYGKIPKYGDQSFTKSINVGAVYQFNKNLLTQVSYKINLLPRNAFTRATGIAVDNTVALGLVYLF